MKPIRIVECSLMAALVAFAISACQKKAQTDMSQANDSTQASQGYGAETPPDQIAPPPEPSSQGATPPKATKSAHPSGSASGGTKGSSTTPNTPSTPSTYASQRP